jgi:hypothetical protein
MVQYQMEPLELLVQVWHFQYLPLEGQRLAGMVWRELDQGREGQD